MVNLAIAVILLTLVGVFTLAALKRLTFSLAIGLMIGGILAGVVLPILPHVQRIAIGLGGGKSIDIQQAVESVTSHANQVRTDTEEVKTLKDQTAKLAEQVADSEQQVSAMQANVREAYRTLLEALAYSMGTRNIMSEYVYGEIMKRLDSLAVIAYPDPEKRKNAVLKILEEIKEAHQHPGGPSTPTSTPSP